jgi:hypothetical protein
MLDETMIGALGLLEVVGTDEAKICLIVSGR